jgi:hypothetical protein
VSAIFIIGILEGEPVSDYFRVERLVNDKVFYFVGALGLKTPQGPKLVWSNRETDARIMTGFYGKSTIDFLTVVHGVRDAILVPTKQTIRPDNRGTSLIRQPKYHKNNGTSVFWKRS